MLDAWCALPEVKVKFVLLLLVSRTDFVGSSEGARSTRPANHEIAARLGY